jgi:glycolate oxidase
LTTFELQQAVETYGLLFRPTRQVIKTRLSAATSPKTRAECERRNTAYETFGFRLGSRNGDGRNYPNRRQNRQKRRRFRFVGLMCGSEGMLGIITEATLKLLPMPEATATVRASFQTMEAACKVLTRFTPEGLLPMAMEVVDKNCIAAIEQTLRSVFRRTQARF